LWGFDAVVDILGSWRFKGNVLYKNENILTVPKPQLKPYHSKKSLSKIPSSLKQLFYMEQFNFVSTHREKKQKN
jgi:hypothetical protein